MQRHLERVMWALTGPIIVWPGYEDAVPKNVKDDIRMARLAHNIKHPDLKEAPDIEAVAYLMTASLAQPPSHDWTRIYLYVSCQYMEGKGIEPPEDIRTEATGLTEQQERMLADLKAWLFKKSMESVKAKLKETKREPVHTREIGMEGVPVPEEGY